jgi:hypothetical protein
MMREALMILERDGTAWFVTDYFSRWGFDDGDDEAQLRAARPHRERVVAVLNEMLIERGIRCVARAEDASGVHNRLRAVLVDRAGIELAVAPVADRLERSGAAAEPAAHGALFETLDALWPEFVRRAEAVVRSAAHTVRR